MSLLFEHQQSPVCVRTFGQAVERDSVAVNLSGHFPSTHAFVLSLLLNSSMAKGSLRLAAAHPCAPPGLCPEAAHSLRTSAACLWLALYLA